MARWLMQMGKVGLWRMLSWWEGDEGSFTPLCQKVAEEKGAALPENFSEIYFQFALREALLTRASSKIHAAIKRLPKPSELLQEWRRSVRLIPPQPSYADYAGKVREVIDRFIDKVQAAEQASDKPMRGTPSSEKLIKLFYGSVAESTSEDAKQKEEKSFWADIRGTGLASNYLGDYYFNKKAIGNPKGNHPARIREFDELYVLPARQGIFARPKDRTISCGFCKAPLPYPASKGIRKKILFHEGDFSPLGVSLTKFINFNYNGQLVGMPVCPWCRLLLLCSFAGLVPKPYTHQEIEGTSHLFVALPDDRTAYEINMATLLKWQAIMEGAFHEGHSNNLYWEIFETLIKSSGQKAQWQLENVLFVEFKPLPSKQRGNPVFTYFNIPPAVAILFSRHSKVIQGALKRLNISYEQGGRQGRLGTEVLRRLLQNIPLSDLIHEVTQNAFALPDEQRKRSRALLRAAHAMTLIQMLHHKIQWEYAQHNPSTAEVLGRYA